MRDIGRREDDALEPPAAQLPTANVDFGIVAPGRWRSRASFNLDAFGVAPADDQVVALPYLADDGLVHGVAGATQRSCLNDLPVRKHGDVACATADIEDHDAQSFIDRQTRPKRGRNRFGNE